MAGAGFFAFLDRMKYINRWGLMRSSVNENVLEHSMQTALLTHALAEIGCEVFGRELQPERLACAALYHDCSEIFTGDLPTPVKYRSRELSGAYREAEREARERLFDTLPAELKGAYRPLVFFEEENPEAYRYIKAADKLSAYIKCRTELASGNAEFARAAETVRASLDALAEELPELAWFMEKLLPGYELTLDEL